MRNLFHSMINDRVNALNWKKNRYNHNICLRINTFRHYKLMKQRLVQLFFNRRIWLNYIERKSNRDKYALAKRSPRYCKRHDKR